MEYTIIKKLNKNSNFTDFLVIKEEKFYRLRRLNSIEFLDIEILSKYGEDFKMLNSSGILFPELIDLKKETPELYYPYFYEKNIDYEKNISVSFIAFLIKLFDNFIHNVNFAPNCIDLEDFYVDSKNNYYYIAPIFKRLTKEKIFSLDDNNEDSLIKTLKKMFVYFQKTTKNNKLKDFFEHMISKEITCVSYLNKYYERFFNNRKSITIRQPHYIGRSNLMDKVFLEIKKDIFSKILIYGKQRVGKTSFLRNVVNRLTISSEFEIFNVRSLKNFNEELSKFVKINSKQKSIELSILEKIYQMQEINKRIIIIIDDYQEVEKEFFNFLKLNLKSSFKFNVNLILITHNFNLKNKETFEEFLKIELKEFEFSEVQEMIASMMSKSFVENNQSFVENIYHHSAGLPGNVEELIDELYFKGYIYYKNSEWHVDEKNIKMTDYNDFVEIKIKDINKQIKNSISELSLLGNSFTYSDIKNLSDITQKEYDIDKFLSTKIIQKENGYYRFFNKKYWKHFYNFFEKKDLEKFHCELYKKTYNFQKKIWHLKQIGKEKQIVFDYIKKVKESYNNWLHIDTIESSYEEISNMNIKNDTVFIYFIKYLIFSGDFSKAKKYLKYMNKKWMNLYRMRILAEIEPKKTMDEINNLLKTSINPFEIFYLKIIKGIILVNSKVEDFKSVMILKNEIYEIYEKYKNNKAFVDLYLSFATDYGNYIQPINKQESQKTNSESLAIAKNYNFKKHILNLSLLIAHDYLDDSYMYENLTEEAISLSKSSNDLSKLPEIYVNKAYINLYKGNIDDFFVNINESIKYSNILNNSLVELRSYGLKAFYYFYIDDMENVFTQIKIIETFMDKNYKRVNNRARYYFYYINSLYFLKLKDKQKINDMIKIIDKSFPELEHINILNKIFISDDAENIAKNTEMLFKNQVNLEEMIYILNEKFLISENLKDLFVKKTDDLIKILKNNGYRLSLSILYEGISNFFILQKSYLKAFKYLRFAVINFRNIGLDEKAKKLEDDFYNIIKLSSSKILEKEEKNNFKKIFYDDIINISIKIISLDNIQEILDKTLNFLKNKFPINDVFLRVETEMFESQSSTSYDFLVPAEEIFSVEPLEVFYISKYNDFKIKYYMRNENLIVNLSLLESLFDTLILLDEYLSATLNRIIHQQNSIKDYLTGAYSRRYLYLRLEEEYQKSLRENSMFVLAMFDLDDFKKVNDTYGHKEGDRVLKFFVNTINENIRNLDILARYGGEEFVLILPKVNFEEALKILERIKEKIENKSKKIFDYEITTSIGVCSSKYIKDKDHKKIISFADKALYESKNTGKNKITVYEE
jgi:diguanylate cyclase (GGDEF)-like protein